MQRPIFAVRTPTQDPDALRRPLCGAVEQHLQPTPFFFASVGATLLRKDERAPHLEVVDHRHAAALGGARRCRHGTVERAWGHQPPEYAVVAQPWRIRGEQLGVEADLTACGLVSGTQQRVPGARTSAPWRLDPVPLALEGVARQRDAAACLAGEEPVEAERQPGLVGAGNRFQETATGTRRRRLFVSRRSPETGHHRWLRDPVCGWPGHRDHRSEHCVRTHLHDRVHPHPRESLDASAKRHRRTHLPSPVRRVQQLARPD